MASKFILFSMQNHRRKAVVQPLTPKNITQPSWPSQSHFSAGTTTYDITLPTSSDIYTHIHLLATMSGTLVQLLLEGNATAASDDSRGSLVIESEKKKSILSIP